MQHIYNVYPPHHQPQWPADDNEARPSLAYGIAIGALIALCLLALPVAIALGLLNMMGAL